MSNEEPYFIGSDTVMKDKYKVYVITENPDMFILMSSGIPMCIGEYMERHYKLGFKPEWITSITVVDTTKSVMGQYADFGTNMITIPHRSEEEARRNHKRIVEIIKERDDWMEVLKREFIVINKPVHRMIRDIWRS